MFEFAPPVRIIAAVSLCCSIIDLFADIILCVKFSEKLPNFTNTTAINAVYGYYTFTAIASCLFILEVFDCVLTIKNNQEHKLLTPVTKSLLLVFEEVPLPICLLLIYTNEPTGLGHPAMYGSIIKLIALSWGIIKFMKMKFCWLCLPCLLDHGFRENVHRCFKPWRLLIIIVNICHVFSIAICAANVILSKKAIDDDEQAMYPSTLTATTTPTLLAILRQR